MQVTINGVGTDVDTGTTVAAVVASQTAGHRRVAVARNGDVVPRSAWEQTSLDEGDAIEVLAPVAGG